METESKRKNLKGCLEWTLPVMQFAGYWFPRSGNTKKVVWYAIYSTIMMSCTLITLTCTEAALLVTVIGQVKETIDGLFVLLTHVMQCVKVITFILKKETIYKLLDCIEEDAFQPRNADQWKYAMNRTTYTNKMAKIFLGMVVGWCLFCGLSAVAESIAGTRQLPVKAVYPFNTELSPTFEIISIYEIIAVLICACANAAMDITEAAFISQICIQLDLLSDTLAHIKDFAETELAKKPYLSSYSKNEATISPELEHEMDTILIECIKHHLKLKEFATDVQSTFGFPLFVQFLTTVGLVCMTLFELTEEATLSPYVGELITYQICVLTEIGIFCWYGNEVIYKSKKLSVSLYKSDWVDCSTSYKKMILFAIANMQKELSVFVGGLVTFSLETFVTVLRTAWSYFLVLDRIRKDY